MVNPLPSAFVRLRSLSCSWQNSRREILRAKSAGPASIVKVEAAGDGGTTLTGADGPYNDEAFRAKTGPHFQLVSSPAGLTAIPQWSSEMVATRLPVFLWSDQSFEQA